MPHTKARLARDRLSPCWESRHLFPIVDSYGGYSKFGYLEGMTVYEESYGGSGVAWVLTLEE